ncbi:helix-turn-helix domain-containing protein [Micromonospora craniellae]|uniref:XRE family transcriptional regulator n=1 Tax=Micromonospora craniellae TaxID=2294034 RepID=A0A372FUU3_9ACTN|nr:helix-turn-helix transcriptional regulator [Micromonospora craniellae]QOC92439.1 helix-turn-helix transcriptional regulator [Micromonospora craniellae]RFS44567.1 XRE family transcriptional regulator [Micromonospora craniellae]
MSSPTVGERLARIRRESTLTQEQLAERSGVSIEVIRKLEQGSRGTARLETLHALARALRVPTSALIGDASGAAARREPDHQPLSLAEIRRAIAPVRGLAGAPVVGPTTDPPGLDTLRAHLHVADRVVNAGDYAVALRALPPLLMNARAAVGLATDEELVAANDLFARTQRLAGGLLIQLRAEDLAQTALSGALDSAQRSGNRVVAATVIQTVTWLLMRQGRIGEAARLAIATADEVEPQFSRATPGELAAWGWLLLGAAAACARDNRPDEVTDLIDAAGAAAVRIGERVPPADQLMLVGGFDTAKVQMQRVEAAAVAGEAERVLKLSEKVPPAPTISRSAWRRHRLDVAWAYTHLRRYGKATTVLTHLRDMSPTWLRQQRYARDIVEQIVAGRRRAMTHELTELAEMMGCSR